MNISLSNESIRVIHDALVDAILDAPNDMGYKNVEYADFLTTHKAQILRVFHEFRKQVENNG